MVLMNGEKIWGKLWWKQALKTTLLCSCSVTHRYGCLGYTQVSLVKHLFVLFVHYTVEKYHCNTRIPTVRESQGKRCFFQGQGKVMEFWNWSGKNVFWQKSGKSQGILWWRGIGRTTLSFSDKRLRQFLPFCIIVIIINIYTHFYLIDQ